MKRLLLVIGILTQLVMSQTASAVSYTFGDSVKFWPTWESTSDPSDNLQDVIGHPDISGGTVTYNSDRSINQITFNNVGDNWSDLFSTDLFINVLTGANDSTWDYIVKGGKLAGNYALYNVTAAGYSAIKGVSPLSDFAITSSTDFSVRNDHPTAISTALFTKPHTFLGTAHFDGLLAGNTTAYEFTDGNVKVGELGFILGWGANCANDVVLEYIPAPEPGTMVLLGFGMLGLAIYGKRRMQV